MRLAFKRELLLFGVLEKQACQLIALQTQVIALPSLNGTYPSGLTTGGRRSPYGFNVNATLTTSFVGIWFYVVVSYCIFLTYLHHVAVFPAPCVPSVGIPQATAVQISRACPPPHPRYQRIPCKDRPPLQNLRILPE